VNADDLRYLTDAELHGQNLGLRFAAGIVPGILPDIARAAALWETWMVRFTALGATPGQAEAFGREAMAWAEQQHEPNHEGFDRACFAISNEIAAGKRKVGT
jgi:hypothetical protein